VFVRPLSMGEGRKIQRISRTSKNPVRLTYIAPNADPPIPS
jgi:hypothetical protein